MNVDAWEAALRHALPPSVEARFFQIPDRDEVKLVLSSTNYATAAITGLELARAQRPNHLIANKTEAALRQLAEQLQSVADDIARRT